MTMTINGGSDPISAYEIGTVESLADCKGDGALCYAIRVPMDHGSLRVAGRAQEFDEASFFLDGQLAAQGHIGEAGGLQELALESDFLPQIPSISITDASGAENLAGPFGLDVPVSLVLSFATDDPVTVVWQTADGNATAGSDYNQASGVATFAAGETVTSL